MWHQASEHVIVHYMKMNKQPADMRNSNEELEKRLVEYEAGVADILAVYEVVEPAYFAAVNATAVHPPRPIASSSTWLPNADLG